MKYFYFFVFVLSLTSCSENKKVYYYIETFEEESLYGNDIYINKSKTDTIIETSDSSAYIQAFTKFTISKKSTKDMKEAFGHVHKKPLSFQLFDEAGNDITYKTSFEGKERLENKIEDDIYKFKNFIKESSQK